MSKIDHCALVKAKRQNFTNKSTIIVDDVAHRSSFVSRGKQDTQEKRNEDDVIEKKGNTFFSFIIKAIY